MLSLLKKWCGAVTVIGARRRLGCLWLRTSRNARSPAQVSPGPAAALGPVTALDPSDNRLGQTFCCLEVQVVKGSADALLYDPEPLLVFTASFAARLGASDTWLQANTVTDAGTRPQHR